MNLLSAQSIEFQLNKKNVLDKLDIHIAQNEFIGLIGPNGAGKSSLLRILAGLVKPDKGNVELTISNRTAAIGAFSAQERAKFMAYLAQHETPVWPLSVANLVALGRSPWRDFFISESAQDRSAVDTAMHLTDVQHLRDRPITELSGGELQRVILARVFAGKPQLIVADEPIAALDIYHQLHMMELLQEQTKRGGAVIAALHDLSLAARFCSRLILLDKGKIVAEGEPAYVLTPENLAQVYSVNVHVDCRENGVVIIPNQRVLQP